MDSLFNYKIGNTYLYRCPVWFKLLFIPIISILAFCLSPQFCLALIIIQFILALLLHFSFLEIISDLRPVFFYFLILLLVEIFSLLFEIFPFIIHSDFNSIKSSLINHFSWERQKNSVFMLLKIFCLFQTSSLLFKTSTQLQIRECFEKIKFLSDFALVLSMFINFIPMTSKMWTQIKKAWFARGGKKGIKMYVTLLPVLFSVGMKKAWNMSRAIEARTK
jgi:hypothetical protein